MNHIKRTRTNTILYLYWGGKTDDVVWGLLLYFLLGCNLYKLYQALQ